MTYPGGQPASPAEITAEGDPSALLRRARAYPYAAPEDDFHFRGGRAEPLAGDVDLSARQPVLATGSNRAPEQLLRKFGAGPDGDIPVTWTRMQGYDVVYSAGMAGYGAIPATLHTSPGTLVRVAVTWLTEAQLARMHETENVGESYVYGLFDEGVVLPGAGHHPGHPWGRPTGCYIARRGALALEGAPVALAELAAEGRHFRELTQTAKLERLHALFGDRPDPEEWILSFLGEGNRARRAEFVQLLARTAVPFEDPRFTIIDG